MPRLRWPDALVGGRIKRITTTKDGGMHPAIPDRANLVLDIEHEGLDIQISVIADLRSTMLFTPRVIFDPDYIETTTPGGSLLEKLVDDCDEEESLPMPDIVDDETYEVINKWKAICTRAHTGRLAPPPMTVMCHGCTLLMARDIVNLKANEGSDAEA